MSWDTWDSRKQSWAEIVVTDETAATIMMTLAVSSAISQDRHTEQSQGAQTRETLCAWGPLGYLAILGVRSKIDKGRLLWPPPT